MDHRNEPVTPGGGIFNPLTFTMTNGGPTVTTIAPTGANGTIPLHLQCRSGAQYGVPPLRSHWRGTAESGGSDHAGLATECDHAG